MKISAFTYVVLTALSGYLVFAEWIDQPMKIERSPQQLAALSQKLEEDDYTIDNGIEKRIATATVALGLGIFNSVVGTTNFLNGVIGGTLTREKLKDIKNKIGEITTKVDRISAQVQMALNGQSHLANVISYSDDVQRLEHFIHIFSSELSVDGDTLSPAVKANAWADQVLSLNPEGLDMVLFNLHFMILGGNYLAQDSIFITYESLLDKSSVHYMPTFAQFAEYTLSLQASGYAMWIYAMKVKGKDYTSIQAEHKERIVAQNVFLNQVGLTWPEGAWGIPQVKAGCPANLGFEWQEGSRYQDTEDSSNANAWASPNHFKGLGGNLRQYFCMKNGGGKGSWPRGEYCIFVKDNYCPHGFSCGGIFWDDEDDSNDNTRTGQIPNGYYNHNTKIYYACRSDGNVNTQVMLPSSKAFYLLRYRTQCQQVKNMKVTEEYLYWDNEDSSNIDNTWGAHPYEDGGTRNHKLHYCYYEPTLFKG